MHLVNISYLETYKVRLVGYDSLFRLICFIYGDQYR